MSSAASTLLASSTLSSGRTEITRRAGFDFRSSATVFIFRPPFAIASSKTGDSPGFSCRLFHENSGTVPLHVRVIRAAAALGHDPDDVLLRILDVAGLAVHAVLGVDLQPRGTPLGDEFIHPGRP